MLSLKVEVLPGTPLRQAAEEAVDLAALLDVGVGFDFNGVHLFVHSYFTTADDIMKLYKSSLEGK